MAAPREVDHGGSSSGGGHKNRAKGTRLEGGRSFGVKGLACCPQIGTARYGMGTVRSKGQAIKGQAIKDQAIKGQAIKGFDGSFTITCNDRASPFTLYIDFFRFRETEGLRVIVKKIFVYI